MQTALAIQVNKDGLFLDNIQLALGVGDMLLYVDPTKAPERHPDETDGGECPGHDGETLKDTLFDKP